MSMVPARIEFIHSFVDMVIPITKIGTYVVFLACIHQVLNLNAFGFGLFVHPGKYVQVLFVDFGFEVWTLSSHKITPGISSPRAHRYKELQSYSDTFCLF